MSPGHASYAFSMFKQKARKLDSKIIYNLNLKPTSTIPKWLKFLKIINNFAFRIKTPVIRTSKRRSSVKKLVGRISIQNLTSKSWKSKFQFEKHQMNRRFWSGNFARSWIWPQIFLLAWKAVRRWIAILWYHFLVFFYVFQIFFEVWTVLPGNEDLLVFSLQE
jgi:hypothetical protein